MRFRDKKMKLKDKPLIAQQQIKLNEQLIEIVESGYSCNQEN